MNILLLGDSLIEYFDWQERFPEHSIANLGIAGESAGGLLSRVEKLTEAYPEADLVFIMTGTNNIAMDDLNFIDIYKVILEKLAVFYTGAGIYIHSLLPADVSFIPDSSVVSVNDSLMKLSQETGIEYVDLYSRFKDPGGRLIREYLVDDGIHISGAGYDVWARVIEGIIAGK